MVTHLLLSQQGKRKVVDPVIKETFYLEYGKLKIYYGRDKDIEKAEGLTCNALGLPWDEELLAHVDVFSAIAMDWVHSALQSGSVNVEVILLLGACKRFGKSFPELEAFLKRDEWEFPKHRRTNGRALHRVFSEWRLSSGDDEERKVRASASELVAVYGLVRNFVQIEIGETLPELATELASFDACCRVVDIFLLTKRGQLSVGEAVDRLDAALEEHMRLHKAAYGTDHILPKHHWLFDVACRLRCKDLAWFLVDCFVLERSHLTVRDRAEHIDNTSQYERSVLAGTLNKQLLALKSMVAASGALLDIHKAAMPGYPDARVANSMQAHGRHFSVGDIVLLGSRAGVVLACVQEGDAFFVIVEELTLIEQITPQSAT